MDVKTTTTTRFYGMNVNGLALDRRGGQLDTLCSVMKEAQIDVMCGQEHNLDTDNVQGHMCFCHTDLLAATLSGTVEHATLRQEEYHGAELEIILSIQVVFMVRSDQQDVIFAPHYR